MGGREGQLWLVCKMKKYLNKKFFFFKEKTLIPLYSFSRSMKLQNYTLNFSFF